jgi:hypothetical protein
MRDKKPFMPLIRILISMIERLIDILILMLSMSQPRKKSNLKNNKKTSGLKVKLTN